MSDIVDAARAIADRPDCSHPATMLQMADLITTLRAEVERLTAVALAAEKESKYSHFEAHIDRIGDENRALRAEVEKWKSAHVAACDLAERHMNEKHTLRAANERYREALVDISVRCNDRQGVATRGGYWAAETARAALAAGLQAWKGMRLGKYRDVDMPPDRIILPLSQEKTDDKA